MAKKKDDTAVSYLENLVKSNKYLSLTNKILLATNVLFIVLALLVFAFKKNQLIVVDSTGRPHITYSKEDDVQAAEIQHFLTTALTAMFEVAYTDFLEVETMKKKKQRMSVYFNKKNYVKIMDSYMASDFVKSVAANKLITKLKFPFAFDVSIGQDKKITATGFVTITTFAGEQGVSAGDKKYEITLYRGSRTVYNPYGLYINSITERSQS